MSVQPNTVIKIYRNVPLDNKYVHTLYFSSVSEQNAYFHGRAPIVFTLGANSYQRVNNGSMRVEKKADELYNCNYLAFQNTNHGNKWFYAFILSVEYVNENVSLINYEIDEMQTYFLDCTLRQSFVEREHAETDEVGDNLQPESVNLGEMQGSDFGTVIDLNAQDVIIVVSDNNDTSYGQRIDGISSGCSLYVYNITDTSGIHNKLDQYYSTPESIVAMYQVPHALIGAIPSSHLLGSTFISVSTVQAINRLDPTQPLVNDFVPHNKKLYTYPFNYLLVDNGMGGSLALCYEYFADAPNFEISGTVISPVKMVLRPCGYKGLPGVDVSGAHPSTIECLTLDGYPMCSWTSDSFSTYLGQNAIPSIISGVGSGVAAAIGGAALLGTGIGGIAAAVGVVSSLLAKGYTAANQSDPCHGSVSSGNVNIAHRKMQFNYQRLHVTEEQARVLDNFFDMYGYSCNRVKVPNISSRPSWNYVKTVGCNITGSVPTSTISKIKEIFDNGVTFWKDTAAVCDYTQDNRPTE